MPSSKHQAPNSKLLAPSSQLSVPRRAFLGSGLATLGGVLVPRAVWAAETPRLRFGVITDVHIGGRKEAPQRLETALRWLDARGIDAVLCCGDVAHTGQICQMEAFANIWYKVFPKSGRTVELMISTGNHDAWEMGLAKQTEENKRKNWLFYSDNAARTWKRLFDEEWAPVWRKEVKGYTFIGAQWPTFKPDLEGFMKAHGNEFDPTKPFFFGQHEHPNNTCHGAYACGNDRGQSVRALSPFPNAVAFSGHSHCSVADERAVWQGTFTSIGAGCLHEGGLQFGYDNCSAFWHPSSKKNLMAPLNDAVAAWGGDPDGGCFLYVEVFDRHLMVHRRSSVYDRDIGPAWYVPVPVADKTFDPKARAATRSAPQFASGAALKVEICPKGCALESKARKGEPCVRVTIPNAEAVNGCRVFTYDVAAMCEGKTVVSGKVFAAGFSLPVEEANRPTDWLVSLKDLPKGTDIVFTATPRECFGKCGISLLSNPIKVL